MTKDKLQIAYVLRSVRRQCQTEEAFEAIDNAIYLMAYTAFGIRSRVQRAEFMRRAEYKLETHEILMKELQSE
jgi:hypothetical protein